MCVVLNMGAFKLMVRFWVFFIARCKLPHYYVLRRMTFGRYLRDDSLKTYIKNIESYLDDLFSDLKSGISEREDSRAFGGMIEKRITNNWESICASCKSQFIPNPGKRTIYDFACHYDNTFYGFDVKTKDLDEAKYSDGGVCAVGNLLKFLANDRAVFVIVEFGHSKASENRTLRDLEYIKLAPFHFLPEDAYRIENLGTGQVRLNYSINQIYDEIDWDRSLNAFFDIFVKLSIKHYERVGRDARKRIDAMKRFIDNGYTNFSF